MFLVFSAGEMGKVDIKGLFLRKESLTQEETCAEENRSGREINEYRKNLNQLYKKKRGNHGS